MIYQLRRRNCVNLFIEKTSRLLRGTPKGKLGGNILTLLGKDRIEVHNGEGFDAEGKISSLETEISSRKALDAIWTSTRNLDELTAGKGACLS